MEAPARSQQPLHRNVFSEAPREVATTAGITMAIATMARIIVIHRNSFPETSRAIPFFSKRRGSRLRALVSVMPMFQQTILVVQPRSVGACWASTVCYLQRQETRKSVQLYARAWGLVWHPELKKAISIGTHVGHHMSYSQYYPDR